MNFDDDESDDGDNDDEWQYDDVDDDDNVELVIPISDINTMRMKIISNITRRLGIHWFQWPLDIGYFVVEITEL